MRYSHNGYPIVVVVFALIVLSGYSASFGAYIGEIGEDARGEYDIVIVGAGQGLDLYHGSMVQ